MRMKSDFVAARASRSRDTFTSLLSLVAFKADAASMIDRKNLGERRDVELPTRCEVSHVVGNVARCVDVAARIITK